MGGFVKRVAAERIGGKRPSPPRAAGTALMVGATAAVLTYRLLRREAD